MASNLSAIPGVQVSAYELANPTPPAIQVAGPSVEYDAAMQRGLDTWTFPVTAFVAAVTDKGAQAKLGLFRDSSGTNSIKAAVESDPTLGGSAQDCRVTFSGRPQVYTIENRSAVLGAEWLVQVLATG